MFTFPGTADVHYRVTVDVPQLDSLIEELRQCREAFITIGEKWMLDFAAHEQSIQDVLVAIAGELEEIAVFLQSEADAQTRLDEGTAKLQGAAEQIRGIVPTPPQEEPPPEPEPEPVA